MPGTKSGKQKPTSKPSLPNGSGGTLVSVDYRDQEGRNWRVLVPEGTPKNETFKGVPVGPPNLDSLGLPLDVEIRLHNQLHARRLFTVRDTKERRQDVMGALMAALRVDVQRVIDLY